MLHLSFNCRHGYFGACDVLPRCKTTAKRDGQTREVVSKYATDSWFSTYMSEAIPLGSALGVELIRVIVYETLYQGLDSMLKLLTVEPRLLRDIEREAVNIH